MTKRIEFYNGHSIVVDGDDVEAGFYWSNSGGGRFETVADCRADIDEQTVVPDTVDFMSRGYASMHATR